MEGGRTVAGGLRGAGQHRFRRLRAVVFDQQGGRRAEHTARGGVRRVLLGGRDAQRWARRAARGEADPAGCAQPIVHGVEGGGAGHRLGHLAGPQGAVEQQGRGGLAGSVRGRVHTGQHEIHGGVAEPGPQPVAEARVLPQQGDGRGDHPGGGRQPQRVRGQGDGGSDAVGGERGHGGAHAGRVGRVGGLLHVPAGQDEAVPLGQDGRVLQDPVGGLLAGRGHHQTGESLVPVGEEHVGMFLQRLGDPAREMPGAARAARLFAFHRAYGQVGAGAGAPVVTGAGQRVAGHA
ncbi:hypothetical protein GCM10017687_67420 [Streptomyces echinatus]